jgi:hypothetical protein
VKARLDSAVAQAVSATEAQQTERMASLLDAAEKRFEAKRQDDMAVVQQAAKVYEERTARLLVAVNDRETPAQ